MAVNSYYELSFRGNPFKMMLDAMQRYAELREREKEAASAARAHELAQVINNPLQSLTNAIYLASKDGTNAQAYIEQASAELPELSRLVSKLLRFADNNVFKAG